MATMYVVREGDSPMSIAHAVVGDASRYVELISANPTKPLTVAANQPTFETLFVGEHLLLPSSWHVVGLGFGLGDDFSELDKLPEFHQGWLAIASQVQAEGGDALELDAAKRAYASSYLGLTRAIGVDPHAAIDAAKKYVLAANTIAGAVQNVEGLIAAAQSGAPPGVMIQAFTGTLIGTLVVTGVVTAGVGAAIVAGVTIAAQLFQQWGLFGTPPKGVEVCPGVHCDPAPNWVINCVCVWADRVISPSSPNWRHFPEPNRSEDNVWFDGRGGGSWHGGTWTGGGGLGSNWGNQAAEPGTRMIDVAFPSYRHLECEQQKLLPGVVGEFQKAFFAAWKANKEYSINGLKAVDDWQVFLHTVRLWNRAHAPGNGFDFTANATSSQAIYGDCPADLIPYESLLVGDVLNNSGSPQTDAPGNKVHINTGSRKEVKKLHLAFSPGALDAIRTGIQRPAAKPGLSTGATVAVAATAVPILAVAGLWIYSRVLDETMGHAFDHVVSKLKRIGHHRRSAHEQLNPIDTYPHSYSTSRNRRVAFRTRLDIDPYYESVILHPDGTATFSRYRRPLVRFQPGQYQLAKIRSGHGELLIYADQIIESVVSSQ